MIGQLTGIVSHTDERFIILNVNGVGYKIFSTPDNISQTASRQGEICFWTHLVVKEDALDLYGFITKQELDFFELLITVSGVGPKSALAVLSLAGMETLHKAIGSGQTEYLTKVSGVGRRIAEKIVLELKDKLKNFADFSQENLDAETDVINALQALGYSMKESREAAKKIPTEITGTNEKIKAALKNLGQ